VITILYIVFTSIMFAQGIAIMYFNLYIWLDEDRLDRILSPKEFSKPNHTFTIMLPAYHEEAVLGETIKKVAKQNYPVGLYEVLIILQPSDSGTIEVAERAVKEAEIKNATILIVDPDHTPLNKPYQLNYALENTNNELAVIFDSEDEVHEDILNVANTIYSTKEVDILQCGVQLMNYSKPWFASHNVLEYYFWFKSRMHAHMKIGAVPLGGNTVFFRSSQLRRVKGWNENCLTEDADLGLRLSQHGAKMRASYDPIHVTKEETPHNIDQFIKQRTRWSQGFIQVVKFGDWRRLGSLKKSALSIYLLGFPIFHSLLILTTPIFIVIGLVTPLPFALSLLSFTPVFIVMMMIAIQLVGLYEFVREQKLKFSIWPFLFFIPTFIPYQLMLGYGALRATYREFKGLNNWEKTAHSGLHRESSK